MKEFDDLIEKVDSHRTEFYQKAIEIHEDERLRGMAGQAYGDFMIIGRGTSFDKLYYTTKGFKADLPVCIQPGNYRENGYYESRYYYYKVKEGKLTVKRKELLHHFPNLTLEQIVEKIEQGIKALPIYKKANGSK